MLIDERFNAVFILASIIPQTFGSWVDGASNQWASAILAPILKRGLSACHRRKQDELIAFHEFPVWLRRPSIDDNDLGSGIGNSQSL